MAEFWRKEHARAAVRGEEEASAPPEVADCKRKRENGVLNEGEEEEEEKEDQEKGRRQAAAR